MTDKKKMRVGRLDSIGRVASELGRLYRQARRGEVDVADASRLGTMLGILRQCLEAGDLEKRVMDLEKRGSEPPKPVTNLRAV
jgi:hypothetical protein